MKIPYIGLRTEIIISFLFLMTISILMLGMIVIKITEGNVVKKEREISEIIATSIKNSIEVIPQKDLDLQMIADIYYRNYGLEELLFVDNNYKIIAHNNRSLIGKYYKNSNKSLSISKSIKYGGKLFIKPKLKKGLSISGRFILIYIFFNSIILIILGSLLLSRLIVRPIYKLVKTAESITDGDLTQRASIIHRNEIGRLGESFNKMLDSLKESINIRDDQLKELRRINTELEEAQEEVVRTEKLATVGRISAGIAHEIGNPLGIILGYTALLKREEHGDKAKDYLSKIEGEVNRINKIIRDLLDLSKPSRLMIEDVDINRHIKDCIDILSHEIKAKNIKIEESLGSDIPILKLDGEHFKQAIINILINAIDAIYKNGRISICTELATFSRELIKSSKFKDGNRVIMISISDNGKGINREDMRKIFDPFFTTKDKGKGTGLGLTICHRIIDSFNGDILVESEERSGTTFRIIMGGIG